MGNQRRQGPIPAADIDHSGTVEASDLALLLDGWGVCPKRASVRQAVFDGALHSI